MDDNSVLELAEDLYTAWVEYHNRVYNDDLDSWREADEADREPFIVQAKAVLGTTKKMARLTEYRAIDESWSMGYDAGWSECEDQMHRSLEQAAHV